ncbi:uncharacterized protein LOC118734823 [Rhagoletis pomonella]|uniref:uncharacterized protein LOC118734823 n=1 Tax=Rhagoletis pomonella TaxID=28610 RepID=UPI00177A839A|nr:uncharacterized protein LOC118734823 [Rhagoletis pomonella]
MPDVDWGFVNAFLQTFKPLVDCTTKLQAEQYVIGDFYRDWLTCELELQELISSQYDYASTLLRTVKQRKAVLLQNEAFLSAIYVDPRFNFLHSPYLNQTQKYKAVEHLLNTFEAIQELAGNPPNNDEAGEIEAPTTSQSRPFFRLNNQLDRLLSSNAAVTLQINLKQKLENLAYTQRVPFEADILEYWKARSINDNDIGQLVQVVLAVPSTQVSVERAFSALGTILTKLRTRLSKETLNNLLIVKLNNDILDKVSYID